MPTDMKIGKRYLVEFVPAGTRKPRNFVATLIGVQDDTLVFNMRPAAGTQQLDKRQVRSHSETQLPHGMRP